MSAWLSVGSYSGSRVDLTADSSSSLLHSIYGSQAFQLPISDSNLDDDDLSDGDDDEWADLCFSTPQLHTVTTRPRSAMPSFSPSTNRTVQRIRRASYSSVNLPKTASSRGLPKRPRTAAVSRTTQVTTPMKRRDSQVTRLNRPQSAYPIHHNLVGSSNGGSTVLKRPKTAGVVKPQMQSVPIRNVATPVAVSSTPQYFGFWNEKPLKPRDWSKKTYPKTKWRRPQSSYGSGTAGRNNKNGMNNGGKNGDENDSSLLGRNLGGSDEDGMLGIGDKMGVNGSGSGKDGGTNMDSNANDGSNNRGDGQNGDDGRLGSGRNGSGLNGMNNQLDSLDSKLSGDNGQRHDGADSRNGLNNNGDGNQNGTSTNQDAKGILGRDGWNDFDSDEYFKRKNRNDALSSLFGCGGGSSLCTRFNLPVDLKTLEIMSPLVYLETHCVLSKQKRFHYSKVFNHCFKKHRQISQRKDLIKGLIEALHNVLPIEDAESVCELVKLPVSGLSIEKPLFGYICAVAERLHGRYLLSKGLLREVIEVVDFEALQWKLRNCQLQEELHTLLFTLSSEKIIQI